MGDTPYLPKPRLVSPKRKLDDIPPLSREQVEVMSEVDLFKYLERVLEKDRVTLVNFVQRTRIDRKRFYRHLNYTMKNPKEREFPTYFPRELDANYDARIFQAVKNYLVTRELPWFDRGSRFLRTPRQFSSFRESFHPNDREVVFADMSAFTSLENMVTRRPHLIDSIHSIMRVAPDAHYIFFGDHETASILVKGEITPTVFFVLDAGERTHTESLIQEAIYIHRAFPKTQLVFATQLVQKRAINQWLPLNAFQYRQIPVDVILDGVRMSYEDALNEIPYPSDPIRDFVHNLSIVLDEDDPEVSSEQLRTIFIKTYPQDMCLNEFVIAYGINGIGFQEWIHNESPFGDGPEAVRVFLGSRIKRDEAKPRWLLESIHDIRDYIRTISPETERFILSDQDNVSLKWIKNPLGYPSDPYQEVVLFGNDITLRGIYDRLDEISTERDDIHFVLTCDSSREAADLALEHFPKLLENPKVYSYTVITADKEIMQHAKGLQDKGYDVEVVDLRTKD